MEPEGVPTLAQIEAYVDTHIYDIFCDGMYSTHVQQCADANSEQAREQLVAVRVVERYVREWCENMHIIARRMDCGLSRLCSVLITAAPIVRKHASFFVSKCAVTGALGRPCFHIFVQKQHTPALSVHHSLLPACQMLWTLMHHKEAFAVCAEHVQQRVPDVKLGALCEEWKTQHIRSVLVRYFYLVCREVQVVLRSDNNFGQVSSVAGSLFSAGA
jgi:hypothetical protein